MKLDYNLEHTLDWQYAEICEIEPPGWKRITVEYIDASPYIFWRLSGVNGNFRSRQEDAIKDGIVMHFAKVLMQLKKTVINEFDSMGEERQVFYKENYFGLFK